MNISADIALINKARYLAKLRKLYSKMKACMDAEGVLSCVESTERTLNLLPDSMKEDLIDTLICTIDETTERLKRSEGKEI